MTTQISVKIQVISSTDDEFCCNKKKTMRKRKSRASRRKYPEGVKYHKDPNRSSNAIDNNENLFQQTRNTPKKIGTSYSNIVKQKSKMLLFLQIAC